MKTKLRNLSTIFLIYVVNYIVFCDETNTNPFPEFTSSNLIQETEPLQLNIDKDLESSSTQPHVKWINSDELVELLSFLSLQSKSSNNLISEINSIVIDTRSSNEYNGWKSFKDIYVSVSSNQTGLLQLYDKKNGHINDAHNFDADWIHLFDSEYLKNLIADRIGLRIKSEIEQVKNFPIIIYDTEKIRLEKVKAFLLENFMVNIVYVCELDNEELSTLILKTNVSGNLFFQEPFYDMLISPEVLNAVLRPFNNSDSIQVKPITGYKLFDICKGGPELHYELSHIPTAMHLNTNHLEDEKSVRKNRTELAKLFLSYGILTNNTEMIILYGNPDPMAAYRTAIIMKWMGIRDIHVLNGGYRSWVLRDLPTESFVNKRVPVKTDLDAHIKLFEEQSYYAQSPINYMVDQNYVSDLVKNHEVFRDQYLLVDVRSYFEHVGETSGYANLKTRGSIPGSLWGKAGSGVDQLEDYRNPDLTMRSGVEILKMWDELGIDYKYKHLIFYCGNAWRSSEVMFYAELMGLYRISLYDGGWLDWTSNLNNSVKLGPSADNSSITLQTYETLISDTTRVIGLSTSSIVSTISGTTAIVTSNPFTSTIQTSSVSQTTVLKQNKTSETSTVRQIKNLTTLSPIDTFYKNQFDMVTLRSNSADFNQKSFMSRIVSVLLVAFYFL